MQTVGIDIRNNNRKRCGFWKKTEHKSPDSLKQKLIENGSFLTTTKDWERIQDTEKVAKEEQTDAG